MTNRYLGYTDAGALQADLESRFSKKQYALQIVSLSDPSYNVDRTGAVDSAVKTQQAINDCAAAGGGIVWMPPGTYKWTSPVVVPGDKNVSLVGCGFATDVRPVGTFDGLTIGTTLADNTSHSVAEGFTINGTGLNGRGLVLNRMHSFTVRRVRVQFCNGNGIANFQSYASRWENVYSNNNTGDGYTVTDFADLSVHRSCNYLANGGAGVHFLAGDSSGCRFYDCDFEGQNGIAFQVDTAGHTMETLLLMGCYFENNNGLYMRIAGDPTSAQVRNLMVIACHFNPGSLGSTGNAIALDRVAVATFLGNKFNSVKITKTANTAAVLIDQSNQWGALADCPIDVLQTMPQGHLLMRSIEAGKVDFGTDADWETYFLQNNVRRIRLIGGDGSLSFPKGSLLPAGGLADGQNPHLGVATVPWQAAWTGTVGFGRRAVSADTTVVIGDNFIDVDASGALRTVNLPDANTYPGMEVCVGKSDGTANNVKILPSGGQTINGAANLQFNTQNMVKTCRAINGAWRAW